MSARRIALFAHMATVLGLVAFGAGSCFNPSYVSGETRCSPAGECPMDWDCRAGVCYDNLPGSAGAPAAGRGGSGGRAGAPAGTAGSGGKAGAPAGTGGTGGKAGAPAGTGGTGATCLTGATHPPVSQLITDFSDVVPDPAKPGEFLFGGSASKPPGGTSRYGSGPVGTISVSNGTMTYTATLEAPTANNQYPYNGIVLYMSDNACIDGRGYTGVSFSLVVTGTCTVSFIFNDSQHTKPADDPTRGACSATSCFASQIRVNGSAMVPFTTTPTVPGMPTATLDPMKLIGFQWQLGVPTGASTGCTAAITLDDVKFY